MTIVEADFNHPQIQQLLRIHLQGMHANSPADQVFALDLSALQDPQVHVYALWQDQTLLGIGALKILTAQCAEIKSMRTHPKHLRKGVAKTLLKHIIAKAQELRIQRLSLETGSGPAFDAAIKLYMEYGFRSGEAFSEYKKSPFNQFFHLNLGDRQPI